MLAVTSVIVENVFLFAFYFLYFTAGPPKRREERGNSPLTFPFDGLVCVNNALIKALKK